MKTAAKLCFACIALLTTHVPALCNVFGKDNRQPIVTTRYPWRAVGYVSTGGTGTLIGPNLVLTAAHVVLDDEGKLRSDLGYFYPDMVGKNARARSWINYVWVGTTTPDSDRENDWAILRLDDNLGYGYGWMGSSDEILPDDVTGYSDVTLVGYSGDRFGGWTPTAHVGCSFRGRDGDRLLHDGDNTRGASGGPMFVMQNGRPMIVAVNVAEHREGGKKSLRLDHYTPDYANIAIPASRFLPTLEKIFPAGKVTNRVSTVREPRSPIVTHRERTTHSVFPIRSPAEESTDSIGIKLMFIPPGEFMTGSDDESP